MKGIICGLLMLPLQLSAQNSNYAFSLQQAIEYALKHNEQIKVAGLEKKIAEKRALEFLAVGLPQITANLDLGHNYKKPTVPFDFAYGIELVLYENGLISAPTPPSGPGTTFVADYSGSANIEFEQMIFNGSYFVGLKAVKTFIQLSTNDYIKTKIDIADAVSRAYYGVLINQKINMLVEKNYNRIETLLNETKILYQNGFAEKIDVSRVKVEFNNLKVEKDYMDKSVELSEAMLKFKMGIPIYGTIELTDDISSIQYESIPLDVLKNFTYANRIEVSKIAIEKKLNELDLKNIRVQRIPKLDLYANYGAGSNPQSLGDLLSFNSPNWFGVGTIGIKINTPIFDGFLKKRQIQQRVLKAQQINLSYSILKNSIDLELKKATINYNKNRDNLIAQKKNMELAQDVYQVMQIKYKEGVGSNAEVLNADVALKQAQTNYYNTLYQLLISKIDMQKALGILLKK